MNKLNEIKANKLELNLNDEWNKWFQNDKYENRIQNTYEERVKSDQDESVYSK